jgi:hypothetical protein
MTVVAIHQPNYLPWAGYFHKIYRADIFVFLDNVQYSKNSYTNRVQIQLNNQVKWMTVPVKFSLGTDIIDVIPAGSEWPSRHLDLLRNAYRKSPCFKEVWPFLKDLISEVNGNENIAKSNQFLIERLSEQLGLACQFTNASEIDTGNLVGSERLASLVRTLAQESTYLSGSGGDNYQSVLNFEQYGIDVAYTDYKLETPVTASIGFNSGCSIVDALFHLGWSQTTEIVKSGRLS